MVWERPSVNLRGVIPVISVRCTEGGLKFRVDRGRTSVSWAWQEWTSRLSHDAVLSVIVTSPLWPESSGWNASAWDLVVSSLTSIDLQGLWPILSLSLVVDINWLSSLVLKSKLGRLLDKILNLKEADSVDLLPSGHSVELEVLEESIKDWRANNVHTVVSIRLESLHI